MFIVELITTITSIVGAASLLVKGIGAVTAITPSTKDDEVVNAISRGLATVVKVLDVIAINPNDAAARPKKK